MTITRLDPKAQSARCGTLLWMKVGEKVRGMTQPAVQYISDEQGNVTSVIVPIELWREIASERETAHLLGSDTMRQRLLESKARQSGIPFEEALEKLGI